MELGAGRPGSNERAGLMDKMTTAPEGLSSKLRGGLELKRLGVMKSNYVTIELERMQGQKDNTGAKSYRPCNTQLFSGLRKLRCKHLSSLTNPVINHYLGFTTKLSILNFSVEVLVPFDPGPITYHSIEIVQVPVCEFGKSATKFAHWSTLCVPLKLGVKMVLLNVLVSKLKEPI